VFSELIIAFSQPFGPSAGPMRPGTTERPRHPTVACRREAINIVHYIMIWCILFRKRAFADGFVAISRLP